MYLCYTFCIHHKKIVNTLYFYAPKFEYCCQLWDIQFLLNALQILQSIKVIQQIGIGRSTVRSVCYFGDLIEVVSGLYAVQGRSYVCCNEIRHFSPEVVRLKKNAHIRCSWSIDWRGIEAQRHLVQFRMHDSALFMKVRRLDLTMTNRSSHSMQPHCARSG